MATCASRLASRDGTAAKRQDEELSQRIVGRVSSFCVGERQGSASRKAAISPRFSACSKLLNMK